MARSDLSGKHLFYCNRKAKCHDSSICGKECMCTTRPRYARKDSRGRYIRAGAPHHRKTSYKAPRRPFEAFIAGSEAIIRALRRTAMIASMAAIEVSQAFTNLASKIELADTKKLLDARLRKIEE